MIGNRLKYNNLIPDTSKWVVDSGVSYQILGEFDMDVAFNSQNQKITIPVNSSSISNRRIQVGIKQSICQGVGLKFIVNSDGITTEIPILDIGKKNRYGGIYSKEDKYEYKDILFGKTTESTSIQLVINAKTNKSKIHISDLYLINYTEPEVGEESYVQIKKTKTIEEMESGGILPNSIYVAGDTIYVSDKDSKLFQLLSPPIPVATKSSLGISRPDGTTIGINKDGTLSNLVKIPEASSTEAGKVKYDDKTIKKNEQGQLYSVVENVPEASSTESGKVKYDDKTIKKNGQGQLYSVAENVPIATDNVTGKVKPDGKTISIEKDGTIKSSSYISCMEQLSISPSDLTDKSYSINHPDIQDDSVLLIYYSQDTLKLLNDESIKISYTQKTGGIVLTFNTVPSKDIVVSNIIIVNSSL